MNSLSVGIFAFLGGVALFIQSSRADGIQFSHKDWELVCDNTRTCRAAGYQADGRDERLVSMLLTREAGPNTPVFMELQLDDEEKTADVRAQVGDLVIPSLAVGKIPQKEAAKLLAVMPDEEELILTAGDKQWTLSLAGMKAVLMKMDDKQGRIGTPGALIVKGTKPEQQVLPPIPVRTLIVPKLPPTKKRDEELPQKLKEFFDSKCEYGACEEKRSIKRLSKEKLIVIQPSCIGTRNMAYSVFIINDRPPYNPKQAIDTEDEFLYDASEKIDAFGNKNKGILFISELHIESVSDGERRLCAFSHDISWAWTGSKFEKAEESTSGMCNAVWDLPTFVSNVVNKNEKVKQ